MSMTLSIRRALADDSSAIADVNVASWRAGYKDLLPQTVLQELSRDFVMAKWSRELGRSQEDPVEIVVVERDHRVVAYSRFGPARDEDSKEAGRTGEIYGFYVHPDEWGTGIARDLMAHVLERLYGVGYLRVTLNVVAANVRARRFYERSGFVPDVPASPWYGVEQVRYRKEL